MRLPNLTAATVFAIATYVGIVRDAQAAAEPLVAQQQPFQIQPELASDVDFNVENHNKIKDCEVVNLVCDSNIVDTIHVTNRPAIVWGADLTASSNTHHRSKPCSAKQCTNIISTVHIDMDKPCYKEPQKQHAAGLDDSPSENVEETDVESTPDSEVEDEEVEDTNLNDEKFDDEELSLGKKHHKHHGHGHHHHKGGHHHGRHHYKGGHHRHRHRHEKSIHPWLNRCVCVGTFCGTQIFGYDFAANAVYTCDKIGDRPKFTKACVGGCRNGECITTPLTTTTDGTRPTATTTDGGVTTTTATTTTATTTTTSTGEMTTTKPDCVLLIEPLKNSIRNSLAMIEKLPLGDEASKLLKLALGTNLTAYFDNGVDSAGSVAALLAHTLPQIVDVLKSVQGFMGPTFDISDSAFNLVYDLVGQITKASSSLASCTGAKPDCTGLVILTGYSIKIGVPIVRAYLLYKFPPAALAFIALQPTIDRIADGLIRGDDLGISDLLKLAVEATTGTTSSFLPPQLKTILAFTRRLLGIIKDCDKTKPTTTATATPTDAKTATTTKPPTTTTTGATTTTTGATTDGKTDGKTATTTTTTTTAGGSTDGKTDDKATTTTTTDGGVTTTTATATTTSTGEMTTTKPDCVPLIEPVKNLIRDLLVTVEKLPLGDEASKLLKVALGTNLTAYFDNGVDSAGSIAATLAHTIPQVVDVIKSVQKTLGPTFGVTDPAFQVIYDTLDKITKASAALASCTGAKVDCTGLIVLSGYAIKIGVPILRAYLTVKFPPAALAFIALQPTIDKISDGLISGNDAGLTDFLTLIVDQTTGIAGSILPAPLKEILGITKPLLNIIKNCDKTKLTITTTGPTTTPTDGSKTATEDVVTTSTTTPTTTTTDGSKTATDDIVTTTSTTTTTSSAVTTTTTKPDCVPLIEPIKNLIRDLLVTVEKLPLGDEASKLLKVALGTNLTAYFDNGIDSAGSIAATLSVTLPQIVDVIKGAQKSLGSTFDIADPAFQVIYDAVDKLTQATAALAACTGAKPDCTGLIVLAGYAIKIGVPIIRAYLYYKFPPAALAFIALQPVIDKIADSLIAGNDAGLTDFLKFITEQTTGLLGAALPGPVKEILKITGPILNIIKNCPKS
ncbi:MAG: hypothetical protein JOS17DRAFT_825476 [Linnemannia elongata]|nr:MAG: hypothetical protein JOS17DRAFT_825476 [Linnemannia elongata]